MTGHPRYLTVSLGLDLGEDFDLIFNRRRRDPDKKYLLISDGLHNVFLRQHPAHEIDWLIQDMGCRWDESMFFDVDRDTNRFSFSLSFVYCGEKPSHEYVTDALCSEMGCTPDDWKFLGYPCWVKSIGFVDESFQPRDDWGVGHTTYLQLAGVVESAADPTLAGLPDFIPRRLKVKNSGFFGPSYYLELDFDTLNYEKTDEQYENRRSELVTPSEEQWRQFRADLDAIPVWVWRKRYLAPNVSDGDHWTFEVAYGDASVRCDGSNLFPRENGTLSSKWTPSFKAMLKAVSALLGGRDFS